MPQCFVSTCGNYYEKTRKGTSRIIYHMFPQSRTLALKWAEVCGGQKGQLPPTYRRVCSQHFSPGCYQRDLQHELLGLPERKRLKPDAVPDLGLPVQNAKKNKHATTKVKPTEKSVKQVAMRSSIRIAKKRSVEELQKNTKESENALDDKENKLKFMKNLKLIYGGTPNHKNNSGKLKLSPTKNDKYSSARRGIVCW